jgi:hypothetical protein
MVFKGKSLLNIKSLQSVSFTLYLLINSVNLSNIYSHYETHALFKMSEGSPIFAIDKKFLLSSLNLHLVAWIGPWLGVNADKFSIKIYSEAIFNWNQARIELSHEI